MEWIAIAFFIWPRTALKIFIGIMALILFAVAIVYDWLLLIYIFTPLLICATYTIYKEFRLFKLQQVENEKRQKLEEEKNKVRYVIIK